MKQQPEQIFVKCLEENSTTMFPLFMDKKKNQYTMQSNKRVNRLFKLDHCYLVYGVISPEYGTFRWVEGIEHVIDYGTITHPDKKIIYNCGMTV